MKLIKDKVNVTAPGGAFPFGAVKDNTGINDGTPVNEELVGDYVQFFEKIMDMSPITPNGLLDNQTNDFQLVEALFGIMPKKYIKEVPLSGAGGSEAFVITKAEIDAAFGALGAFHTGFLGSGTSSFPNTDFQIFVYGLASGSASWELMETATANYTYKTVSINDASGDITITVEKTLSVAGGHRCRVVIIG